MPSLFFSSRLNLALQESNKYFYKVRIFPCQCTVDKHYQGNENIAGWTSSTLGSITFSNPDDDIFFSKVKCSSSSFLSSIKCIYVQQLYFSSKWTKMQSDGNPHNSDTQPPLLVLKPVLAYPYVHTPQTFPLHPQASYNPQCCYDVTFSTEAVKLPHSDGQYVQRK